MIIKHKQKLDASRVILLGTIIMTAWLLTSGILAPNSFAMSFANTGIIHAILRAAVLSTLIAIFMSTPPRSALFRLFLGAMSTIVLVVSFVLMTNYSIGVLDALLYLMVSIVLALEALEFDTTSPKQAIKLSSSNSSTQSL